MAKIKHPLIHQFSLLRIMLLKIKLLRAQKRHVSSVCQTNMLKKMGAILAFMVLWELVFYFGKAQGHTQAVSGIALPSRSDKLFFQDGIILAWKGSTENPNPFELSLSLEGHTAAVICLTVGEKRLYSGSMDNTVRTRPATEGGNLEVFYTHNEEHGVIALCEMPDAEAKPILFCSCNDDSICLYDLPLFNERGRIF
ncbi:zinc finger CCCH domain-containing protein 63-like isoform X2 [Hevea brasiliensis]|uniref:zinc finger CCCH domain-containing protein 63-like isoform X2 n=1 Tax=Hevea brasiliensis TaxID=3981 RepID=UPI0025E151F5|nr:zinc finger CCCH domain-containing protein 63-like isoform X2 [Hevea brasiliensis]